VTVCLPAIWMGGCDDEHRAAVILDRQGRRRGLLAEGPANSSAALHTAQAAQIFDIDIVPEDQGR
jgi:hypothetical protein